MAFFLFILVNACLFVRPAEIIPDLLNVSIYEYLIISCFLLAVPELLRLVAEFRVEQRAITLCILGVYIGGIVSQISVSKMDEAADVAWYMFKILIYYVLLISLVNTAARLRIFLFWMTIFCLALCTVTVLQYNEIIELPTLKSKLVDQHFDPYSLEETKFDRLQGSGIFQDPNEFCLMMAVSAILCLYQVSRHQLAIGVLWLAPLGLCLYAITLTQSRGGFIAFMVGIGAMICTRFGWKKAAALACLGLPVVLLMFGGRQTSISATDTGQQRIQLWSDWIDKFRGQPVFGAGMKIPELNSSEDRHELRKVLKQDKEYAAHNSYLHAFGELGFFGGMFFIGAFFVALWGYFRLARAEIPDPAAKKVVPFAIGIFCAYAAGMMTLSVCYVVPTYMMLGIAEIVQRVTPYRAREPLVRFNATWLPRLAGVSVAYLAFIYLVVRLLVRWA